MLDCPNCGAILKPGQSHCHVCGVITPYQEAQRVCMNCGTPATRDAKICLMCGHTIDALPDRATSFSVSWPGIILGLVVAISLVYWFFQIEPIPVSDSTPTVTATQPFIPPTNTTTPTITPTPPPAPTLTLTPTPTPEPVVHTIKTGETLLFIADKYKITLEALLEVNNITEETILQVGQKLIIPFPTSIDSPGEASRERPIIRYTIKSGDTLSGIAFEYDTSISAIELANPGIDLDLLSVGQEVIVPLRPPTFTPTPTITPTPTFTPGPPFRAPELLLPADQAIIEGDESTVLLSWTATGFLDNQTFYVVYLTDENGQLSTYWTRATSYRLPVEDRPTRLTAYSWYVVVMRQIGVDKGGIFYGQALSNPSVTRTFSWR